MVVVRIYDKEKIAAVGENIYTEKKLNDITASLCIYCLFVDTWTFSKPKRGPGEYNESASGYLDLGD